MDFKTSAVRVRTLSTTWFAAIKRRFTRSAVVQLDPDAELKLKDANAHKDVSGNGVG